LPRLVIAKVAHKIILWSEVWQYHANPQEILNSKREIATSLCSSKWHD